MNLLRKSTAVLLTNSRLPENMGPWLGKFIDLYGDTSIYSSRTHDCKVVGRSFCKWSGWWLLQRGELGMRRGFIIPFKRHRTYSKEENYPDIVSPLLPLRYSWQIILILTLRIKRAPGDTNVEMRMRLEIEHT